MRMIALFSLFASFALACNVYADSALQTFERLKSLQGTWVKADSENSDFYIDFAFTANGTVLMENWMYKGNTHSVTVYHLNGENVIATHYCPQGNQPRLVSQTASTSNDIAFAFLDATNLLPEASHQHSLAFEIIDTDTVVRHESYKKGDTVSPSQMRLIRMQTPSDKGE